MADDGAVLEPDAEPKTIAGPNQSEFCKKTQGVLQSYRRLWRILVGGGLYSFLLFDEAVRLLRCTVACTCRFLSFVVLVALLFFCSSSSSSSSSLRRTSLCRF